MRDLQEEIAEAFREVSSANGARTVGSEFRRAFKASQPPTGAVGRWFMTPHAVRRYLERFAPRASYEQALGQIIREGERSHFVKANSQGAQVWRGPSPRRLRYIAVPDTVGLPVLVTVLPPFDGWRRAT